MGIFKKKLWRQKRKSDKKAKGRANRAVIEQLEPRLLLAADLVVNAAAAVDLTVKLENTISGPAVQVVNNGDQSLVDSQLLSETSRVVINGSAQDDSVTIDLGSFGTNLTPFTFSDSTTTDSDTLKLTGKDTAAWNINNANTGMAELVTFSNVENLSGGDTTRDSFIFSETGTLSGKVDGGAGEGDTLDYSSKAAGVAVDLFGGTASWVGGGIANIENVIGTASADTITGDTKDNVIDAGGGADVIEGRRSGIIDGGTGSDTITSGAGSDTIKFRDGWGRDTITDSDGIDILDFSAAQSNLTFTIKSDGTVTVTDGVVDEHGVEVNSLTAAGINNIIGGKADNTFVFEPGANLAGTITAVRAGQTPSTTPRIRGT